MRKRNLHPQTETPVRTSRRKSIQSKIILLAVSVSVLSLLLSNIISASIPTSSGKNQRMLCCRMKPTASRHRFRSI